MRRDIYKAEKQILIDLAKTEKRHNPNDKARVRFCINQQLDSAIRSLDWYNMKEIISEKEMNLYSKWLESLACRLHP